MLTKAEERKALAKIREIVEGLGEDSYVGTAFEGCFEIAEQNIDNDWACSMKQRVESAEKKLEKTLLDLDHKEESYKELRKAAGQEIAKYQKVQMDHEQLMKDFDQMRLEKFEAENRAGCAESKIVNLEAEIIKLKAKLYDLMVK